MKAPSRSDDGPHGELETALLGDGCKLVAGIDEVGRGAWAGPVSVGVAVVDLESLRAMPAGLRDSKELSPAWRERLFPLLVKACVSYAVGHAGPDECDGLGMTAAQSLATRRALAELRDEPDAVVVDGRYDFTGHRRSVLVVGGDRTSLAVAAASVLAKVTRDALLVRAAEHHPGYALERNKGYASLEHRNAVARLGLTSIHRKSWTFADPFWEL
jgi:ribonuclease HII